MVSVRGFPKPPMNAWGCVISSIGMGGGKKTIATNLETGSGGREAAPVAENDDEATSSGGILASANKGVGILATNSETGSSGCKAALVAEYNDEATCSGGIVASANKWVEIFATNTEPGSGGREAAPVAENNDEATGHSVQMTVPVVKENEGVNSNKIFI